LCFHHENLSAIKDKVLREEGIKKLLHSCSAILLNALCLIHRLGGIPSRDKRVTMPVQQQEQETLNVKLVHFTKQNSPDEPVQLAFSVIDEQGKEEIITGEIPYSYDLFKLCQENGWLNLRRGVASIRETRTQRRAMSA
jgi:hypothetical protein